MKVAKQQILITAIFFCLLIVAVVYNQFGYFSAVEDISSVSEKEEKVEPLLRSFTPELKSASTPRELKAVVKRFEDEFKSLEVSRRSEMLQAVEGLRKLSTSDVESINGPAHLQDKKALMEHLINAYRKEIPDGPIGLRAAYLNFLFDVQQSLLSTGLDTEEVALRKMKERIAALKSQVDRGGDPALQGRFNSIESSFNDLQKKVEDYRKWNSEKVSNITDYEKRIPKMGIAFAGGKEDRVEELRRSFLIGCILLLSGVVLFALANFLAYKFGTLRAEARKTGFQNFLSTYGSERSKDEEIDNVKMLAQDPDWSEVIRFALKTEEKFINTYRTLIAVPQSMQIPLGFFSREGKLEYQNSQLEELLGVHTGDPFTAFLNKEKIKSRDGEPEAVLAMIENSFASPKTDVFELSVRWEGKDLPYELLSFPVTKGPLAGGKIFIFREIRNEIVRIERSVKEQIDVLRVAVTEIIRGKSLDLSASEHLGEEIRTCLKELDAMSQHLSEQELRRKAERDGMLDQIEKQNEILERLSQSMLQAKSSRDQAKQLISGICESDENWFEEVRTIERDMERWLALRDRLETELGRYADVVERAKVFEADLSKAVGALSGFVANYQGKINELTVHCDKMKLHATNLSFVSDPKLREVASHGRAYVEEMSKFISIAEAIGGHIQLFLEQHPAKGPASALSAYAFDDEALESFEAEESRIGTFVKRWSKLGQDLLKQEEAAQKILGEMDAQLATMVQLGETSLVINHQTKGNLTRFC